VEAVLREFWYGVQSQSAGLVAAVVFIGAIMALSVRYRGQDWIDRLKTPKTIFYIYVAAVLLAVSAKVWYGALYRLLYLTSVVILVMGVIAVSSVALFDVFLGRYRRVQVPAIVRDVLVIVVYALTVVVALGNAGVNVSSIIATSAVLTAIIGFALQDLLSSVMSGLAIQMEKPFHEGHWVRFGEQTGRVLEINWRSTKIETLHRDVVVIPNNVITRSPLVNFSVPDPVHRRRLNIGFRYEAPPNLVRQSILRAVESVDGVLEHPEPYVVIKGYGDFSIDYRIHFFINQFAARERIEDSVFTRIWYQLRRDGLSIPFPIQDINVRRVDEEQVAAEQRRRKLAIVDALSKVDFLKPLGSEELELLAAETDSEFYGEGERVIEQGRPGSSFFIVENGALEVRVAMEGPGGSSQDDSAVQTVMSGSGLREHVVAHIGRHDFFGERSLMTGEARSATVVAVTDVELFVISKDAFAKVITSNDALIEEIGRRLVERQAQTRKQTQAAQSATHNAIEQEHQSLVGKIRRFFQIGTTPKPIR